MLRLTCLSLRAAIRRKIPCKLTLATRKKASGGAASTTTLRRSSTISRKLRIDNKVRVANTRSKLKTSTQASRKKKMARLSMKSRKLTALLKKGRRHNPKAKSSCQSKKKKVAPAQKTTTGKNKRRLQLKKAIGQAYQSGGDCLVPMTNSNHCSRLYRNAGTVVANIPLFAKVYPPVEVPEGPSASISPLTSLIDGAYITSEKEAEKERPTVCLPQMETEAVDDFVVGVFRAAPPLSSSSSSSVSTHSSTKELPASSTHTTPLSTADSKRELFEGFEESTAPDWTPAVVCK